MALNCFAGFLFDGDRPLGRDPRVPVEPLPDESWRATQKTSECTLRELLFFEIGLNIHGGER